MTQHEEINTLTRLLAVNLQQLERAIERIETAHHDRDDLAFQRALIDARRIIDADMVAQS